MTKICSDCLTAKPLDKFYKHKNAALGRSHICAICDRIRCRKYYQDNREKASIYSKNRYKKMYGEDTEIGRKNRAEKNEMAKPINARYREKNREKRRAAWRSWYAANRPRMVARAVERIRDLSKSRPRWFKMAMLQEFYDIAAALKMQTGQTHHVDHIWPLKGRGFSGLTVPYNLQVIPDAENWTKHNSRPAEGPLPTGNANIYWLMSRIGAGA